MNQCLFLDRIAMLSIRCGLLLPLLWRDLSVCLYESLMCVFVCVCLSATLVSPAKTAELLQYACRRSFAHEVKLMRYFNANTSAQENSVLTRVKLKLFPALKYLYLGKRLIVYS